MHKTDHQDILKYILLNFGERKMLRYRTYQRLDVGRAAAMAGKRLKTFRQFIVFWWRTIVERERLLLPNWIARYLNDGIVIALLLRSSSSSSSPRERERDTEVVKINLWRWRQQLSLRHLPIRPKNGMVGEIVVYGQDLGGLMHVMDAF